MPQYVRAHLSHRSFACMFFRWCNGDYCDHKAGRIKDDKKPTPDAPKLPLSLSVLMLGVTCETPKEVGKICIRTKLEATLET